MLLHFPLSKEDADDVKGTLRYMMSKVEITPQVKEIQGTSWFSGLMVQLAWPLPCVRLLRLASEAHFKNLLNSTEIF